MSLEDEFKIDISDDQASRLHTVADVLACVVAECRKGRGDRRQPAPLSGQSEHAALRIAARVTTSP